MRAVCFDFDGTLVDSEVFHSANWIDFLKQQGHEVEHKPFMDQYAGVTWDRVAAALIERFDLSHTVEQIIEQMERVTYEALMQRNIPAKTGVKAVLDALHGHLPLAVVTGAPREYVEGVLGRHGWLEYFDHIVCGDDVENNKPAPDVYNLACQHLSLEQSQVVAIEDSNTGLVSAHTAGLNVVLVNENKDGWHVEPHHHVSSMDEAHPILKTLVGLAA